MANWYNGSLDRDVIYERDLALESVKDVAIIGNGNVAMDISRVLLKDPSIMAPHDIPTSVLEHLRKKQIRSI
jgi:ferredoxin/flavodoxin---NADP+ reductase